MRITAFGNSKQLSHKFLGITFILSCFFKPFTKSAHEIILKKTVQNVLTLYEMYSIIKLYKMYR